MARLTIAAPVTAVTASLRRAYLIDDSFDCVHWFPLLLYVIVLGSYQLFLYCLSVLVSFLCVLTLFRGR